MYEHSTPALSPDSLASEKERAMSTHPQEPRQPRLRPGDGRHRLRLWISLGVLLLTTCALPELLYFVLRYTAHQKDKIAIAVPSAAFGASSLFALGKRTWSLGRLHSTSRPIGGARWGFDFFHWNFLLGFIYITIVITLSTTAKPANLRVAAMPLSLLMVQVCGQLVGAQLLAMANASYPCRVSSMPRGQASVRPALYTIIEDLVAVDGEQGTAWREEYDRRYKNSPALQNLLARLGWVWGLSGLAVATMNIVLFFVLENPDVAYAIGWAVPWVWVALMAIPTWFWATAARD